MRDRVPEDREALRHVADSPAPRPAAEPCAATRRDETSITFTWLRSWSMICSTTLSVPRMSIFMRETVPSSVGPTLSVWML